MVKRQNISNTRRSRQNISNTRRSRQKSRSSRQKSRSSRQKSRGKNMRRQSTRKQNGGYKLVLAPAELVDTSMKSSTTASLNQGADFFGYHKAQHGGQAPVGYTGMLDEALRASARVGGLDTSVGEIRGMKDQVGGRRKRGRKGRKGSRKMRGGMRALGNMDVNSPGMLLDGAQARQALSTMNHEWKLAENPSSFAPRV